MQRMEQVSEFKEKLVAVNRVTKVVKGGRNFRFAALVVVGDEKGRVGSGIGKAAEISEAIRKGVEDAKKHLPVRLRSVLYQNDSCLVLNSGRNSSVRYSRRKRQRRCRLVLLPVR